jgi:competence protein ComEC
MPSAAKVPYSRGDTDLAARTEPIGSACITGVEGPVAIAVSSLGSARRGPDGDVPKSKSRVAPVALLVIAMAGGIAIDRHTGLIETPSWINLALAALTVSALTMRRSAVSTAAVLVSIVALGGAWHHARWNDAPADDLAWGVSETPRPAWVRGTVTELLGLRTSEGYGPGDSPRVVTRMVVDVIAVADGRSWRSASGRVLAIVAGHRADLRAGDPVEAAGQLARVAGPLNPGEFDYRAFLRAQRIRLRLSIDEPEGIAIDPAGVEWPLTRKLGDVRAACRRRLTGRLGAGTAPLASALILGQREGIDPDDSDAFARTGTTHLLAISGLQLQALAASLAMLFRLMRLPRRLAYGSVAMTTIGYSLLVGLAPSVARSAVMTLTFCLAAVVDRKSRPANTLALAGLLTLILSPFFLFDVGCQLSFLAIGALIWLVPPAHRGVVYLAEQARTAVRGPRSPLDELERSLEPWWIKALRRLVTSIAKAILASSVVWLAALPLVAMRFHLVSPIGIVLNLPLIPLTTLALILGAGGLALGVVWAPLGIPSIRAADVLLQATEAIVRWGVTQPWGHRFVAGPGAAWVLGFYALLCLATFVTTMAARVEGKPRRLRAVVSLWSVLAAWCVPACVSFGGGAAGSIEGEILAVGHGLAVVLRLEDGKTLLYDCGRMGDPTVGRRIIAPALWSRGVTRIDSVLLSHADQDHYNGLPDLMDRFAIGELVIPPGFADDRNPGARLLLEQIRARGIAVRELAAPAAWDRGGARFTVLHPPAGWHPKAPDNARSLVLDVEHGGRHLLLTGDLDQLGTIELVGLPAPEAAIDLMLAPHHGGKGANPMTLYHWAKPLAVVVSQRQPPVGSADALTPLERGGIPLLRTWHCGAVHFQWGDDRIVSEGFLDRHDQRR